MEVEFVRSWVKGRVVSRGAVPPVAEACGFTVEVSPTGQVARHVPADADESLVRKPTATATAPGTLTHVFLPPQIVALGWCRLAFRRRRLPDTGLGVVVGVGLVNIPSVRFVGGVGCWVWGWGLWW
ncbi:hypothetical protein [Streptomyces sp. NPDC006610]|uniref:hypothetical protein n=1 Tax=Streptomyces sp. NPDC006610 TaxID=3154584 RepID=UPI0033B4EC95